MNVRLLTEEELRASETALQTMEREHLDELWAITIFPAPCAWCEEAGEPSIIETRDDCGGFDMDSDKPICEGCRDMAEEEANSPQY